MGPAAQRGTDVHQSIDDFMLGKSEQLHPEIHAQQGLRMMHLRDEAECSPELLWLLTRDFELTDDETEAWIKGYMDLHAEYANAVDVHEWKTGRIYDDHDDAEHRGPRIRRCLCGGVPGVLSRGQLCDPELPLARDADPGGRPGLDRRRRRQRARGSRR